jgi:hypothetical protein
MHGGHAGPARHPSPCRTWTETAMGQAVVLLLSCSTCPRHGAFPAVETGSGATVDVRLVVDSCPCRSLRPPA